MQYHEFIEQKTHLSGNFGFEPTFMPDMLFDFQKALVEWAVRKGRAAIFADCGMGKTLVQLAWAQNVVERTNKRVLILTPLAVASQTVKEAEKIDIEAHHKRTNWIASDEKIIVTNYEKLHLFDPADFIGAVCDESSILKHYTGATQKKVTRFLNKLPYRLLCTATAAPNDYVELGTSAEALGELSHSDMLTRFFKQLDDKGQKKAMQEQREAEKQVKNHFARLSFRVHQSIGQWRLKNHATVDFWKWVTSWARACRMPSDLGFPDDGFILPPLHETSHIIQPSQPPEGWLFTFPAVGLQEEREERKRTLQERVDYACQLAKHDRPAVIWCHLNPEGDLLEKSIPDSRQVAGRTPDDEKEEIYNDFTSGKLRVIVIKPKIGAWGMNWQHCNHVITFATNSYEQYYQSVRRCWRFGQKNPVQLDIIASEGEKRVIENMKRKSDQAAKMFSELVKYMNNSLTIKKQQVTHNVEVPSWL